MRRWLPAIAIAACLAMPCQAQYTLSATSGWANPGTSFTSRVLFDHSGANVRGWSYGVCHDQAVASLAALESGTDTQVMNQGGPPDFESLDLFPGGFTHGVVICFMGCSDLPPGLYDLSGASYDAIGDIGESTTLCFCETLGAPTVPIVIVDVQSTAITPVTNCGSMGILAPLSGLTCAPVLGECSCDVSVNWSNPGGYDAIQVYRDGTLAATLPGTASETLFEDELGLHEYCVAAELDGQMTAQSCCEADCPEVSVATTPVSSLACDVDDESCSASLAWLNESVYDEIVVMIDGSTVLTLAGTAENAVVALPSPGAYQVCVSATTICGDAVEATCCDAECLRQFSRADANGDGMVDIADPIAFLTWFFADGVIPDCDDAADSNDDGLLDIADGINTLAYLFDGGATPPAPFLTCGFDPTDDALRCVEFAGCP